MKDPKQKVIDIFNDSAAMEGNEPAFLEALENLIEHVLDHPEDY